MATVIRDAQRTDHAAVLRMNAAGIPHVNLISADLLARLHREAFAFRVAEQDSRVCGFVLALAESAEYDSLNFRWFQARYPAFVYIDRIVVDADHRGTGVGRALYESLEADARMHAPLLTCEVNLQPPNPASMAFHTRYGFVEAGQQDTERATKRVSLMVKDLGAVPQR